MIAEQVMTTQQVADRLSELFKENKWEQAQDELYSEDAKSIEPEGAQGLKSVDGLAAIKAKAAEWNQMVEEFHGGWAGDPIVAGNHIAVAMGLDVTIKGAGRTNLDEIAVYEVKNGKIVKEQFFF
jgi:hypothetical protein